ncbi:MAG TPA: hypothetical protein DHV36_11630 [Desulfobacteraceae bacterium]|nr:hypothetical protein [Desulfobacteraceae bacterium]|tara:strand:+ start:418 stop:765 length:348 start_codon:yes stop_codon:yes gene_type:complete
MYLDKENVSKVKEFIKGTGLNFSSYLDLLVKRAANKIELYEDLLQDGDISDPIFTEENGKLYFDINLAHDILGIGDGKHFDVTESQRKKINEGKWKYEIDKEKGPILVVGKVKNK